ncbi:sensor histidine kinase RegB [Halovulum sp. GXIMD14793]
MNMAEHDLLSVRARSDWVRVRTLINLRWMAVAGQSAALIVAPLALDIELNLHLCALLIGLSALYNIAATLIYPETKRLSQREAALTLLGDLAQLAALLYLSGGLTNPFAVMILAQTIIAATVLTLDATVILGMFTLAVITLLMRFHVPLHDSSGQQLLVAPELVWGMWAALGTSIVFISVYARRVSIEAHSMSEALTATQLALERERRLTTLGGVVAAAAHELGTPLATIKLASGELSEELADQPDLKADADLIREQADRCRLILAEMGASGKQDRHVLTAPFSAVMREAAEPHLDRGKEVIIRVQGSILGHDATHEPDVPRRSEIIHGLRNLVQNAVDFAITTVWIDLDWTEGQLVVRVGDDGKGYPTDLLGRIGDPFVRRRQKTRPGYEGMGLGLFIAKTLLERTGARLTFTNGLLTPLSHDTEPETATPPGAIVEIAWERRVLEVPRGTSRGPLGNNSKLINS